MYNTLIIIGIGIILLCLSLKMINWSNLSKITKFFTRHLPKYHPKDIETEYVLEDEKNRCIFLKYLDDKNNNQNDQRTMAILDELAGIHFWITIIGFYYLVKIIVAIIKIFLIFYIGTNINDMISQFLQ